MSPSEPTKKPRCIVAIGGSAGALEAFEKFFKNLPDDVEASFVVLQHMDPAVKSMLSELLGRMTKRPVHVARNGEALQNGHVYALEPGTTLGLAGSVFTSRTQADNEERRYPIDFFFSSLAAQYGSHAIGIVVSGNADDGTKGLKLIQQAGGRALVQEPSEARFDGMPRSAIARGAADRVMPIAELARSLSAFIECSPSQVHEIEHAGELRAICEVLFRKTGHDFSAYKKTTVARRVERRLHASMMNSLAEYIEFLEKDPAEPKALLRDLLISVTKFFRDPEVFAALQTNVIPALFSHVRPGESLRIWVPACATGEEAYTIGILLREHQRKLHPEVGLQVFATDIDREALDTARTGVYPESVVHDIPKEYFDRYFRPHDRGYQASQELREMCIFSEHSLLKNPPFSRIDLISCRNLFIYWEPELQNRVLPLFHYALNPSGYLLLGPAESVSATAELFKPLDKKNRIFQKLGVSGRHHMFFPVAHGRPPLISDLNPKSPVGGDKDWSRILSHLLLENFAPPAFVVSETGDVVFYSGRTSKFLDPPTGVPTNNLFSLICKNLRPQVHSLLHRAVKSRDSVMESGVTYEKDGQIMTTKITARPLPESDPLNLYLVVFQETTAPKSKEQAAREGISVRDEDKLIERLQEELRDTREHLQNTIEEVRSSNEELLSMNEELQSANEELQTSKEELQSTNEELETVNAELARRVDELDTSNSDLQNFFQSSQVPILFLDREFRIQKFTPNATRIFRLIPADLGRSISDISTMLDDGGFVKDFEQVLHSLQPIERAIKTKDGLSNYIMRVGPYKTVNNVIAGVVVTFSDVSELTRAQAARMILAAIVEGSTDAIISKDLSSIVTSWNQGATDIFGYTAEEMIGRSIKTLFPKERLHEEEMILAKIFKGERISHYETERLHKDGRRVQLSISVSPVRDTSGKIVGAAKIARDITALKKTEQALKEAVRSRDEFLSVASHELKTPLTSLRIQTQMRKRHVAKGDRDAFTLEKIKAMLDADDRQINRLTRLIDDMLDVGRISSGRLTMNFEITELCSLLHEVAERFSEELSQAGCKLTIDCDENIHGEWDRFRIEQVVANLLSNALKYGAGKPVIVRGHADHSVATITVEDQGMGISSSDRDRIFKQFERAVSNNSISGLGLGLHIVKQIVEAHGGLVEVMSELGRGSKFTVKLPLQRTPVRTQ